ncbi:unnamed protein product, partial [Microthlaspi erraticum]
MGRWEALYIPRFLLHLPSSFPSITQENIRSAPPFGFSRYLGFARSPLEGDILIFVLVSRGVGGSSNCLIMTSNTTGER